MVKDRDKILEDLEQNPAAPYTQGWQLPTVHSLMLMISHYYVQVYGG